jgi:hypothetical protein
MSATATDSTAWPGRDDPEVVALREHLLASAGLRGLEIVGADEIDRAVRIFRRDGFVVVDGLLASDQLVRLRGAVDRAVEQILALDDDRRGNRGSHRYSFGGSSLTRSMLHVPEWQMLLELPGLAPLLTAIFGSTDYSLRAASGDFCLPGAIEYQPLHPDMGDFVSPERTRFSSFSDPRGIMTTRDLPPPYVCVNFLVIDSTPVNGPTRQIPGSQHSREPIPTLEEEPEWMRLSTVSPAPAGAAMIRDVRAWHGGTPNVSDEIRAIPNLEFYAPWFREPTLPDISYADHQRLSAHARHVTRYNVLDSSLELETGFVLGDTPGQRPSRGT